MGEWVWSKEQVVRYQKQYLFSTRKVVNIVNMDGVLRSRVLRHSAEIDLRCCFLLLYIQYVDVIVHNSAVLCRIPCHRILKNSADFRDFRCAQIPHISNSKGGHVCIQTF